MLVSLQSCCMHVYLLLVLTAVHPYLLHLYMACEPAAVFVRHRSIMLQWASVSYIPEVSIVARPCLDSVAVKCFMKVLLIVDCAS